MEVLRWCPLAIAQLLVHCAIALSTAVLDRVAKTMSVAPLLTNNLDSSKQKTSNLLSPAPPPYSWSLLGKCGGPAPPPSSKISWSFDLAWNPDPKSSRARIDKRTARGTGNTRYRYNQIGSLDHKMADNHSCVSLTRTNTLSSTITEPIKTWTTSNKSYSYNLLHRRNKMYTHDLFYLQQEWESWLAPVYKQIRTTKSQLTQCTTYKCH